MKLTLLNEITIFNKDIYIFKAFDKQIIINSLYSSIELLDINLSYTKKFNWREEVYIYFIYTNNYYSQILNYCPDENLLININTKNNTSYNIDISKNEHILSPIYTWLEDFIIFMTYDKNFIQLDINSGELLNISDEYVKKNLNAFYAFGIECLSHQAWYQVDSMNYSHIYKQDNSIIFYCAQKKIKTESPLFNYHDVIFLDDTFAFVSEKFIELHHKDEIIEIRPSTMNYAFLKAIFFTENQKLYLIVLAKNNSKFRENKILKYCIEK
jgi:hypothetical protein